MRTTPGLRKANAIVSALLLTLFAFHGIWNALLMQGVTEEPLKAVDHTLELLCWVHIAIGIYLTVQGVRAARASGVSYPGENRRYIAIRVSGIAIAALMLAHMIGFGRAHGEYFNLPMLIVNILFVCAIATHVVLNVRPYLMSLGISMRPAAKAALVLGALFLLLLASFIAYYVAMGVR